MPHLFVTAKDVPALASVGVPYAGGGVCGRAGQVLATMRELHRHNALSVPCGEHALTVKAKSQPALAQDRK